MFLVVEADHRFYAGDCLEMEQWLPHTLKVDPESVEVAESIDPHDLSMEPGPTSSGAGSSGDPLGGRASRPPPGEHTEPVELIRALRPDVERRGQSENLVAAWRPFGGKYKQISREMKDLAMMCNVAARADVGNVIWWNYNPCQQDGTKDTMKVEFGSTGLAFSVEAARALRAEMTVGPEEQHFDIWLKWTLEEAQRKRSLHPVLSRACYVHPACGSFIDHVSLNMPGGGVRAGYWGKPFVPGGPPGDRVGGFPRTLKRFSASASANDVCMLNIPVEDTSNHWRTEAPPHSNDTHDAVFRQLLTKLKFLDRHGHYYGPQLSAQETQRLAKGHDLSLLKKEEILRKFADCLPDQMHRLRSISAGLQVTNLQRLMGPCPLEPLAWGAGSNKHKRRLRLMQELYSMRFFVENGSRQVFSSYCYAACLFSGVLWQSSHRVLVCAFRGLHSVAFAFFATSS